MVRPVVVGKVLDHLFHATLDVDHSGNSQWAFYDVHDVTGDEPPDVRASRKKLLGKFRVAGTDDLMHVELGMNLTPFYWSRISALSLTALKLSSMSQPNPYEQLSGI